MTSLGTALVLALLGLAAVTDAPDAAAAGAATTAWQDGAFHLDSLGVVSRANIVLGQPNINPTASIPLGNGSLGVSAWSQAGFTAQLNRSDTLPDRKSPGQVNLPGLTALTNAADYSAHLDVTDGVFIESGAGITLKAWVSATKDTLIIDVTGANPDLPQTANLNLWSPRKPTAAVSGTVGTLYETWLDNTQAGASGRRFGSLSAITASGRNVTTNVATTTQIQSTFQPNADGSFRVVVAAPVWDATQGDAGEYAASTIGTDASASTADLLGSQQSWWTTFWNHSGVVKMTSTDGSAEYIENLRTLYTYEEAASMKDGINPGSQAGEADMFAWSQDKQTWTPSSFWLWNLRGEIAANLSTGNYQLNTPIFNMYINDLSAIEEWTHQQMGGLPGACVPETMRFNGNGGSPDAGANASCSIPAGVNWNSLNITSGPELSLYMWEQYQATGDLEFLKRAFPFMESTAHFLLAYQQLGADGLLHSIANAHESQWSVKDPTTNIAAMQAVFPIIAKAADLVGHDSSDPLLPQFAQALSQIPPYPRVDSATRLQLLNPDYSQAQTDAADATGTDMIGMSYEPAVQTRNGENIELEPLWPWNQVSDQTTNLWSLEQRAFTNRRNKTGNDWSLDALQAARLQQPAQVRSLLLSITQAHQVYPNGFADIGSAVGYQPYLEQSATAAAAVNEALAQDFDGILRFAPAWPTDWDVSGTVYVQGKSKVDVEVRGGQLVTAAIEAGSTSTIKVKNPWPGQEMEVVSGTDPNTVVVAPTAGAIVNVPITAGESYLVERVSAPTSTLPYAAVSGTAPTAARHLGAVQIGLDPLGPSTTAVVGSVLNSTNSNYGLTQVENTTSGFDGPTTAGVVGGLTARTATNSNIYFDISDTVARTSSYQATWTVSYYDQGTGTVAVQFDDGSADPYRTAGTFTLTGTNTWKTATISGTGAYFGGLEKSGADFRLRNTTGATLVVHSVGVSVTGPSVPAGAQFPPAPVITSPAAFATVPTGSAISGTTEPDGTVTVSEGTTVRCTATASHTGSWSCTPATPLTVGQHSITGKVTDPNGLVGKASAALTFIASDQPAGTATVGSVIGVTNYSYGMSEDEVPSNGFDGPTTAGVVAGRTARTSVTNNMYFDVDNSVAFAGFYQATWTVNYYDQGTGSISVQYDDGSTNPYSPAATTLPLTNTNTWKTATTTTTSAKPAYFGGKQHSAADFRLRGSVQISVHSVAVKITGAGVPSVAKFAPAPVITSPAAGTTAGSTTPTISGTSEPAATVNVAEGSTPVCQATATDTGSWSCTPGNGLAGGQHTIVATATDFTSTPAPASGSVTFAIPVPTGAIVGTVTDAAGGAGLGNVCVYLYVPGNSTSAAYATCTRTNGGYTLTGVPAASYNVAFYDPAGAYVTEWYDGTSGGTTSQGNAQTVTISANGTATINAALSLVASGYLSGTVRDTATGKTLGDICAYVYPAGNSAAAAYATCTLADGSYQLGPIAPADYNIAFYDPAGAHATQWYAGTSTGSADQEHAVAVTVTGGNHTVAGVDANLTLVPVGTISGAVTAASDSSPLGGVCVFLYRPNDASSAAYATCTAGDGSYSLGGVTAGSYNVAFYDPAGGYLTQWYDGSAVGASSQAEASTVTINAGNAVTGGIGAALPAVPSGVVTGKVTDATTSAPLGNVCVYFYQAGNTAAASYATCTLADGTYGIANVSAGNYNAAFYDPSGVHATQWFDGTAAGAASRSGATVVTVNGGNRVTSNVNAVLGPTG